MRRRTPGQTATERGRAHRRALLEELRAAARRSHRGTYRGTFSDS